MSPDEWSELKRNYRDSGLVMACGQDGVPKTSSNGTQFFAHKSGVDCQSHEGGPESPEHLATKAAVARAAREMDWDAVIEFPAADRSWIADVLVCNGTRKIAIEAQWSPQSQATFERRQKRYEDAGLESFWLVAPGNTQFAQTVPHYTLGGGVEDLSIELPTLRVQSTFELVDGVQKILRGEILPIAEFVAVAAAIKTQMSKCWNCEKWMSLWTVVGLDLESRCGGLATLSWRDPWELWAERRHEQAVEAVIRKAIEDSDLAKPTFLKTKFSEIAQRSYVAMNCPTCGFVQGDGLLAWRWNADEYIVPFEPGVRLPLTDEIRSRSHDCIDIGRGMCEQAGTMTPTTPPYFGYPPPNESVAFGNYREEREPLPPRGSSSRRG
jgi:hypothetical protein